MVTALNSSNRILVVDDDRQIIGEYFYCLGSDFEPDIATSTLTDLEKVLFGEHTDENGAATFHVDSCDNGEDGIAAVALAVRSGQPYAIVFLDIRMPPGIDGVEAAQQIRKVDPNVNIVLVSGSNLPDSGNLGSRIPPADRIFFFKKPFHSIECRQLAAALCGKWHADLALRHANEVLEQRVMDRTAELHRLAYFDPVTRRPNRLKLIEELQAMIDMCGNGESTAVILLDIERFSFLNETMGYDAGTTVLRAIASRLARTLEGRFPDRRVVVGRFGADEFACLVPGMPDDAGLHETVDLINAAVVDPYTVNGRDLFLKSSIGIACSPEHGCDSQTVFRCAESALHRSMRRLDGSITYYQSDMQFRARHQFDMEAELRQAIDLGEITVFFQPQVCLVSRRLAGVEALARWLRPDGSLVSPTDFIRLGEEMGLSDVLFSRILRKVCGMVAKWRLELAWDIPVSINLSAHQLRNRQLAEQVDATLKDFSVDASLINLELTETALLEDLVTARPMLCDLSNLGVGIQIDDFGTGYSSLSYLAELPARTLKIDQSFVARLTESANNERVVQAIVALARAMSLEVIAEGVETRRQLDMVRALGCDLAQGFLIARPMPEPEFLAWCEAQSKTAARRAIG